MVFREPGNQEPKFDFWTRFWRHTFWVYCQERICSGLTLIGTHPLQFPPIQNAPAFHHIWSKPPEFKHGWLARFPLHFLGKKVNSGGKRYKNLRSAYGLIILGVFSFDDFTSGRKEKVKTLFFFFFLSIYIDHLFSSRPIDPVQLKSNSPLFPLSIKETAWYKRNPFFFLKNSLVRCKTCCKVRERGLETTGSNLKVGFKFEMTRPAQSS